MIHNVYPRMRIGYTFENFNFDKKISRIIINTIGRGGVEKQNEDRATTFERCIYI